MIFYRESDKPFGFEVEFMAGMVANRADWLTVPALVFNAVGGGILSNLVVPAVIIGGLLLFRRPWGAIYYVDRRDRERDGHAAHQGDRRA